MEGRGINCAIEYLSTPSVRRATADAAVIVDPEHISIHALREEGDRGLTVHEPDSADISIHALREEGDAEKVVATSASSIFLSTPSVRRATRRCSTT